MEKLKKLQSWILSYERNNNMEPTVSEIKDKINVFMSDVVSDKIDFDKLIIYFNKVLLKNTRVMSKKAKDSLNQRIKEGYEKSDIVKVIDNVSHDSHHKDSNFKYVTLEFLSRPQIFERYSSMKHQKPISQIKDVFTNQ